MPPLRMGLWTAAIRHMVLSAILHCFRPVVTTSQRGVSRVMHSQSTISSLYYHTIIISDQPSSESIDDFDGLALAYLTIHIHNNT
jgi:hypothetical protein